jgi:hypothetical protein
MSIPARMAYVSSVTMQMGINLRHRFNVFYSNIWRDYGLMWAHCVFNFAVVFLCSWLCLGGARTIGKAFSKAAEQAKMANGAGMGIFRGANLLV